MPQLQQAAPSPETSAPAADTATEAKAPAPSNADVALEAGAKEVDNEETATLSQVDGGGKGAPSGPPGEGAKEGGEKGGFFSDLARDISLLFHSDAKSDPNDPNKTRVADQGNQFEAEPSAWDKLMAWKGGQTTSVKGVQAVPTNADALGFFYELVPSQRTRVFLDEDGMLRHIFANFTSVESGRVISLCDFPLEWKIYHWYTDTLNGVGNSRDILRTMISNSPLGQRLAVVQDENLVTLLQKDFAADHPENLFGEEVKTNLYPDVFSEILFDGKHPKYAAWRDAAAKLDARGRWEFVSQGAAANITLLKGLTTATGDDQWTSLLKWTPKGAALSPDMRAFLDTAKDDGGVSVADRAAMFDVRWSFPLVDPGMTFAQFQTIWNQLAALPMGLVTSDVVTQLTLSNHGKGGGSYNDITNDGGFGTIDIGSNNDLAHMDHTVRHEVGHAADVKAGGFSAFSSGTPAAWRKWMAERPWLLDITSNAGGPSGPEGDAVADLLSAEINGGVFNSPFGPFVDPGTLPLSPQEEQQKFWQGVDDDYLNNGLASALKMLKDGKKLTGKPDDVTAVTDLAKGESYPDSKPDYLNSTFYVKKYGEFFAYQSPGGNDVWARSGKNGLSGYTLCSPYEFYADLFAAYFETPTKREANVPGWAGGYFASIASTYDTAAMDDKDNTSTTALTGKGVS